MVEGARTQTAVMFPHRDGKPWHMDRHVPDKCPACSQPMTVARCARFHGQVPFPVCPGYLARPQVCWYTRCTEGHGPMIMSPSRMPPDYGTVVMALRCPVCDRVLPMAEEARIPIAIDDAPVIQTRAQRKQQQHDQQVGTLLDVPDNV